jgi:hypothetical protein
MNNATVQFILSLAVAIPAVIGVVRYKRIEPAYHPFIYCMILGLIVEIIAFVIIQNRMEYGPVPVYNIYALGEALLFLWLFYNWGSIKAKHILYILTGALLLLWIWENFILGNITKRQPYFRIVYYLLLIILGVSTINNRVVNERKDILKNSVFLICFAAIILFSFKLLIRIGYMMYDTGATKELMTAFAKNNTYVNLAANLIYAIAALWIPRKKISLNSI